MKKSEIAQKYPRTWAVYKNYRPYCRQSFYNSCINLFKYPNLPFESIQEPTWIICEKYLTSPELFEHKQLNLRWELTDKTTNKIIADSFDYKWKLVYTKGGVYVLTTEDELFNVCCDTVEEEKRKNRENKATSNKAVIRQEILNSYTKED